MNDALVLAVGVAISPLPIAVLTMILSGRQARTLGSSFALGWAAGVTGSTVALVALVGAAATADESPLWITVPELVLGLAFLALAAWIWRGRDRERPAQAPRWLVAIDGLTPGRSAGLGLALAAANPKNLGLVLAAAIALAEANATTGGTAAAATLFVMIGTAGVAVPLALTLAAPGRSHAALASFRGWLVRYDAVVLTVVGAAIGAKLVFDGLTTLLSA